MKRFWNVVSIATVLLEGVFLYGLPLGVPNLLDLMRDNGIFSEYCQEANATMTIPCTRQNTQLSALGTLALVTSNLSGRDSRCLIMQNIFLIPDPRCCLWRNLRSLRHVGGAVGHFSVSHHWSVDGGFFARSQLAALPGLCVFVFGYNFCNASQYGPCSAVSTLPGLDNDMVFCNSISLWNNFPCLASHVRSGSLVQTHLFRQHCLHGRVQHPYSVPDADWLDYA